MISTQTELKKILKEIDHKSYGLYKRLAGEYDFTDYRLCIDHVQGDPFAAPSRVRVCLSENKHDIPTYLRDTPVKKRALEDCLLRRFSQNINRMETGRMGSGKSGRISTCRTGQEVLERIAVLFIGDRLEARMEIGFPARGRTILAAELSTILFEILPKIVEDSFMRGSLPLAEVQKRIDLAVNQSYIRGRMREDHLVAFLANGSVLARESGVSDRPMRDAVPFASPKNLEVTMKVPCGEPVTGMGIPCGITVVTGGGYHGKSTLLKAVEAGVYDHILHDGREYVLTDDSALKIRAEDGRVIKNCDISPFIRNLPGGEDTADFSTENASGSTSQAANVIEGIESGAETLLIDEDTTATNFMVRDEVMARLVADEKEPITPFIRKVRSICEKLGVSTVIVVGSCGEYLQTADLVLQLDCYRVFDVTQRAKEICRQSQPVAHSDFEPTKDDKPFVGKIAANKYHDYKIKSMGKDALTLNHDTIDLRYLEQITDAGQVAALGAMFRWIFQQGSDGRKTRTQLVREVYQKIETEGFLSLIPKGYPSGHPVLPRPQELFAALSRLRRDA